MTSNVAVQHMQGWRGAITIHDECGCEVRDRMQRALRRGGEVQQMRLCNEYERATDANGVQQMRQQMRRRRWVQWMRTATNAQKWGCAICASGCSVQVTQIRNGGSREC